MELCRNQTIQKKNYPVTTVVQDIKLHRALRLDENIKTGTKIIEYVGEYIGKSEFEKRKKSLQGSNAWYIAQVGLGKALYIDASNFGNKSRFINHSYLPNSRFETWYVDNKPRLIVVATFAIEQGTHLTVSYMDSSWNIPCVCGECDGNYSLRAVDMINDSDST